MEPRDWDVRCDAMEREYAALIEDATCADCANFERCFIEGHSDIGVCRVADTFMLASDSPAAIGCGTFEEGASWRF